MLVPSELEESHTRVLPAPEVVFQRASSLSVGHTRVPLEGCYHKDRRAHPHRSGEPENLHCHQIPR